jgi:predicted nucleotidyltransferase
MSLATLSRSAFVRHERGRAVIRIRLGERAAAAAHERRVREERALALVPVLAEHLATRFRVRRVILWGSLARGDFGISSDIDLVVVGLPSGRALFRALAELQDIAADIDVDLVPWEDMQEDSRCVARDQGRVILDHQQD